MQISPEFSARQPPETWQLVSLVVTLAVTCVGVLLAPRATLVVIFALLAVPFLCVVLLRSSALYFHLTGTKSACAPADLPDTSLPMYSILVPLFDEAEIVRDLLDALAAIDYPVEKLEILLIVESSDPSTQTALLSTDLAAHIRIVVVPPGEPQTKPRALNHALQQAKGACVVVYDAEDIPDPRQLRQAAALLASDDETGCVQACLNVYNRHESFFARQFTIEYTALFDCLVPALRRLGFPVPLGGTSNHFARPVLDQLGGWDSFNVTEDADLGICLARAGYHVQVLNSTTWEEAPSTFPIWLRQRTRWLKGWMQTYLVHMRHPRCLLNELGWRGFLGLQVFMGGVVLSVLVHPWIYLFAAFALISGNVFNADLLATNSMLWWIGLFNLIVGYLAGMFLGGVAVWARGWRALALSSIWMPVYWLLISYAAYRALLQLVRAPFHWEKTQHRARTATRKPPPDRGHLEPVTPSASAAKLKVH